MLFHEKGLCLFYHMSAKAAFSTRGLRHTFSCTGLTSLLHVTVRRHSSNHSANYIRIKYSVVTYLSGTQLQDWVDLVTLSGSSHTLTCWRIALQKPAAEQRDAESNQWKKISGWISHFLDSASPNLSSGCRAF